MTKTELYKETFRLWGVSSQLDMMIEECGELVVVIQHWKRDRVGDGKIAEEIADVEIMCEQLRALFCDDNSVDFWKEIKLTRLEECIKQTKIDKRKRESDVPSSTVMSTRFEEDMRQIQTADKKKGG